MKKFKKTLSIILATCLMILGVLGVNTTATEVHAATSFDTLKAEFPNGSTWNSSYKNKAWQCHGFACMLADRLTGTDPYNWSRTSSLETVKAGDIIRFNRPHSILVTAVSGDTITYVDCNWVGTNTVQWDQQISKGSLTSKFGSLSAVWCSPSGTVSNSSSSSTSSSSAMPAETASITAVSIESVSAEHISVKFSCSTNTKLAKVLVTSTQTGEKVEASYTSGLDNITHTFNTSSMNQPGKTFTIFIYGYTSTAGGGETLHRVTYMADSGYVTLPSLTPKWYIEGEPEKLVAPEAISGWYISDSDNPATKICCVINSKTYNCALSTRTDVTAAYPNYQTTNQGFRLNITPKHFNHGNNEIKLIAILQDGTQHTFYNKTITGVKLDESLFDYAWYYAQYSSTNSKVKSIGADGQKLKDYYYNYGIKLGHSPNICFDPVWYFKKNTDLPRTYSYTDVYEHYVMFCLGNNEPRETSCFLNLKTYKTANNDLSAFNTRQLTNHYFLYGSRMETRVSSNSIQRHAFSIVYNAQNYAKYNPDIAAVYGNGKTEASAKNLWDHFWLHTISGGETRQTNSSFNMHKYRYDYKFNSNYTALWHYLNEGCAKGLTTI